MIARIFQFVHVMAQLVKDVRVTVEDLTFTQLFLGPPHIMIFNFAEQPQEFEEVHGRNVHIFEVGIQYRSQRVFMPSELCCQFELF